MSRIHAAALLAALFAVSAPAVRAADHHHHHAATEAALADGVVKKVDKAGGKLTVAHGPLPNGMPAMTMAFKVKEAGWLDKVKPGDAIRFRTAEVGGETVLVELSVVNR